MDLPLIINTFYNSCLDYYSATYLGFKASALRNKLLQNTTACPRSYTLLRHITQFSVLKNTVLGGSSEVYFQNLSSLGADRPKKTASTFRTSSAINSSISQNKRTVPCQSKTYLYGRQDFSLGLIPRLSQKPWTTTNSIYIWWKTHYFNLSFLQNK